VLSSINGVYENRLEEVRALLVRWHIEGLLIGSSANRRWVSGFTGSAGWIIITEQKALLATDFRYWTQASHQSPLFELCKIKGRVSKEWTKIIAQAGVESLGVESQHLTVKILNEIGDGTNVRIFPLDETIEKLREVKTKEELKKINLAAAISDEVMELAPKMIKLGLSERELAWKLERELRERGAHALAFPIIVASGPNGAMAHHQSGERTLARGDSIIIDMGARVGSYNSDLTRTFHLSGPTTEKFMTIYNLVLEAQEFALEGIKAGITGKAADNLARSKIEAGGYGSEFGHSLGHGIGLEVHENPRLSSKGKSEPLLSGAVVTVEPGIYIKDWGGIRIEDLVLIKKSGVEILSKCPKQPLITVE
jgi:Xaa-Pro aminopeptidase